MTDNVNHPAHYSTGSIECIDAIGASMSKSEFLGYLKGNVLKYVWRYDKKNQLEDLHKASWYLNKMIDMFPETNAKENADYRTLIYGPME